MLCFVKNQFFYILVSIMRMKMFQQCTFDKPQAIILSNRYRNWNGRLECEGVVLWCCDYYRKKYGTTAGQIGSGWVGVTEVEKGTSVLLKSKNNIFKNNDTGEIIISKKNHVLIRKDGSFRLHDSQVNFMIMTDPITLKQNPMIIHGGRRYDLIDQVKFVNK